MLLLVAGHLLPGLSDLEQALPHALVRRNLRPHAGLFCSLAILARPVVYQ